MNAPFDPEETRDSSGSESAAEDLFGENSETWGAGDPEFDEQLRERLGPLPAMGTPPYAFERVLLAGRRRRARKVWSAGAAAALVVMAGTAGTTVALQGAPSAGHVAGPAASGTRTADLLPSPTADSATPSPSASATPTPSATSASPSPSASSSAGATTPQCHSDDLQLTVSVQPGSAPGSADALLIVLHNNSAHACTTYGYPGLQTENVNEQLQTTTVTRTDKSDVSHLTVAPGGYVSTLATFTTVAAGTTAPAGAGCGAPSYYLAVIPPNEQNQIAATIAGGPVTVCGDGVLDTPPMAAGQTGGQ